MKIRIVFLLFLLIFFVPFIPIDTHSTTLAMEQTEIEQELTDSVQQGLNNFDFSEFDQILNNLDEQAKNCFANQSFFNKILQILNGEIELNFVNFLQIIFDSILGGIGNLVPIFCIVLAVTLLCGLINHIKSDAVENSAHAVIDFVCVGIVVVLISGVIFSLLSDVRGVLNLIKTQMDLLFPIILTLVASVGGAVSVGFLQPTLAILSNVILTIFDVVLVPIFIIRFIFLVLGSISDGVKLNKFDTLFGSIFKWIAGICFSVFSGAMLLQGMVAGSFDNVSIRATKFALKNYVPILGGYLSDGFNIVMASSVLIKNAIGLSGILLLLATILSPVAKIVVFDLGLKLTASIIEPITKSKVSDFLMKVSKLMSMLIMIVLGIGFMYLFSIGLLLCTANIA